MSKLTLMPSFFNVKLQKYRVILVCVKTYYYICVSYGDVAWNVMYH